MNSHHYDYSRPELLQSLAPSLGGALIWALILHLANVLGLLPSLRPTANLDQTILVHQADAAQRAPFASNLLLGDSSCLMDVDAALLENSIGETCLNLGTLSFLDLQAAARLLQARLAAHSSPPANVLLLMHPEALRRAMPEARMSEFFNDYLDGTYQPRGDTPLTALQKQSGLLAWNESCLNRWLPPSLQGAFARRYGFCNHLETYMDAHKGSAIDPRSLPLTGNMEYSLALAWEGQSRSFSSHLPKGTALWVGISPIPKSLAPEDYQATRDAMLATWAQWLGADIVLEDLPATLPDASFATTTHLNEEAVASYTLHLAQAWRHRRSPD